MNALSVLWGLSQAQEFSEQQKAQPQKTRLDYNRISPLYARPSLYCSALDQKDYPGFANFTSLYYSVAMFS
jgi:hypothetical protein